MDLVWCVTSLIIPTLVNGRSDRRTGFAAGAGRVAITWLCMTEAYEPASYWSTRLSQNFNLRGVGHIEYGRGYNDWLYRQKRNALGCALPGRPAGSIALDIGSGVGWVVSYLLDRGFRVTGCDIAEVAVDGLAERYPPRVSFRWL